MIDHLFQPVMPSSGLAVAWHHLPALYMLDFHVWVLAAIASTAVAIMVLLMPAMRRTMSTVLVVSTCLGTGFLAAYSLLLPDWQASLIWLPPAPLGFHDTLSPPPLSLRRYSRRLGIHIGLNGANITLLALPIKSPAGCTADECHQDHSGTKGCFPELVPKECPPGLEHFFVSANVVLPNDDDLRRTPHGNHASPNASRSATSRKLLWQAWSEGVERAYGERRRGKPLHFSRAAPAPHNVTSVATASQREPGPGGHVAPGIVSEEKAASGKVRAGERLSTRSPYAAAMGPAWFDERVDWVWGSGSRGTHRAMLERGVPGPVLAIGEHLSRRWDYGSGGGEGSGAYGGLYDWGGRLRRAGHFTSCLLTAALVLWGFSIPIQMSVPESGAKLLGVAGLMMLSAGPLYAALAGPAPGDALRIEGVQVRLRWGACVYSSAFAGAWAAVAGFCIAALRRVFPGALATDFDLEEVRQRNVKSRLIE